MTYFSASLSCAAHFLAVRLKVGSRCCTHNHSTLQPWSTAACAYAWSLRLRSLVLSSVLLALVTSLLLCPLARIHTVITDEGISDRDAQMLEAEDVRLIVAQVGAADRHQTAQEG